MDNQQTMPDIGDLIELYLKENRTYKSALARALNISPQHLLKIRRQDDMYVSRLWQLSQVLKHNFIADIAAQLPADYTGALHNALAEKDEAITALKEALAAMAKERDIYKELLQR